MTAELAGNWWGLLLLGLGAGILSGSLGLGSGILLIPVMVMVFGFAQKSAQGTALAVMVPMALLGAFRYWKNPQIDVNLAAVAFIAAGALVGSLIGTELAARAPGHGLKKAFAVYLLIIGLKMLISPMTPKRPAGEEPTAGKNAASIQDGSGSDRTSESTGK